MNKASLVLILSLSVLLTSCSDYRYREPQWITLKYVHAVACSDQNGELNVVDAYGKVILLQFGERPICDSWNSATWWDIKYVVEEPFQGQRSTRFFSAEVTR